MAGYSITLKLKHFILIFCAVLSFLVIVCPEIFYQTIDENKYFNDLDRKILVSQDEHDIPRLRFDVENQAAKLAELKSAVPWVGEPSPSLKRKIKEQTLALQSAESELRSVIEYNENLMAQRRGLVPVFSKPAFDEARNLFWKRQGQHKEMSVWMWSMDIIFGSTRGDSLAEAAVWIIVRLAWNLSFGIIFALIDFAIRLPFYIAEYQLYTFPAPEFDHNAEPALLPENEDYRKYSDEEKGKSVSKIVEPIPIEGIGKIRGYVDGILFYFLAILGALGGTIGLLLCVWVPLFGVVIGLGYFILQQQQRRQQEARRGPRGFSYQDHQQYFSDVSPPSSSSSSSSRPRPYQGTPHSLHDD